MVMKADDIKIDLKELEDFKKRNNEERLKFIDEMASYVKRCGELEWSRQQNIVINGQIN